MMWMKVALISIIFILFFCVLYLVIPLMPKKKKARAKTIKKKKKGVGRKFIIFNKVFPKYSYNQYFIFKFVLAFILYFFLMFKINIIFGVVGFFIGLAILDQLAAFLYKKNLNRFERQLVDGLNIIANALISGASFNQGVEVMVKYLKDPLSKEFNSFLKEVRMGLSIEAALNNLAERIESDELKIAVVSINVARESGGTLSEILFHVADTIRDRDRINRKIDALTSQGKLSGFIVSALPFILAYAIYLIDPEMIAPLFQTFLGQIVLLGVLINIFIGFLWINIMVKIDI